MLTTRSAARERGVGRGLVARFPRVDAVVGLAFLLVADQRRAVCERLLRGRDRGQDVVVDVDELERVGGDVGIGGDDGGDLLALVAHLVGDEHRLRVARQRRHPRQAVLRHEVAGDDRDDAVERGGGRRVDAVDARVRDRSAQDRHVQHAGQRDVVEVVALALDETPVLVALHAVADPADLGGRVGRRVVGRGHALAPAFDAAAVCTALTMFMYPVQRQMFPEIAQRTSSSDGAVVLGDECGPDEHHPRRAEAALEAVLLLERGLDRVQGAVALEAFDRRDLTAVGLHREHGARLHRLAVEQHRARAATRRVAADVRAGQPGAGADVVGEEHAWLDVVRGLGAVDGDVNFHLVYFP